MADFPRLKTGAVAQFPSDRTQQCTTNIYKFVDGSEQRFKIGSTPLKRWLLRFDLLDEAEVVAIEQFFQSQAGRAETFSFTDPWDNTVHANCSFEKDSLVIDFRANGRCITQGLIKENR